MKNLKDCLSSFKNKFINRFNKVRIFHTLINLITQFADLNIFTCHNIINEKQVFKTFA